MGTSEGLDRPACVEEVAGWGGAVTQALKGALPVHSQVTQGCGSRRSPAEARRKTPCRQFSNVCRTARRRRSTQKHHAYIFCSARLHGHTLATLLDPWPHFGHTLATLWPHLFAPGCNKMLRIGGDSVMISSHGVSVRSGRQAAAGVFPRSRPCAAVGIGDGQLGAGRHRQL